MTINISLKHDIKGITADLTRLQRKQIPFAQVRALTMTAKDAQDSIKKAMRGTFDRPTRFTLNSTFVSPATKANPSAYVWLRGWALKGTPGPRYLGPQVLGGRRKLKRSEQLLQQKGLLTPGHYLVPARGVKLDRYGNIPRAKMQKVLANLRAHYDTNQHTQRGNRTSYFYGTVKGVRGIWERKGRSISAFMIEVSPPKYRVKLDMFGITDKVVDRRFAYHFTKSLQIALRTAR